MKMNSPPKENFPKSRFSWDPRRNSARENSPLKVSGV